MMNLRMALRNILRHRGRTAVSLLMIAGAVAGLVIFSGFAEYILSNMRRIVIENQFGHIQVGKNALWDLSSNSRQDQWMENPASLAQEMRLVPGVRSVWGRISFFGLISTGEVTISAKGLGFDPKGEADFIARLPIDQGQGLQPESRRSVLLGAGLRKKLNVGIGDSVTVLSYTLDGVVNAIDLKVEGIFRTSNSEMDDNVFMLPLATVQNLLDTDRVEVLAVHLIDTQDTDSIRDQIQSLVQARSMRARTWFELSNFYRQAESFFRTQNHVVRAILLALVFLGILNTVGMSVYERTGEIGTVRSLGETDVSVIALFALEGGLLGVFGAALGALAGQVSSLVISVLDLKMELPGTSTPVPILIEFLPSAYVQAMAIVAVTAVLATWWPARRAVRMTIVEALRRNI